MNVPRLGLIGCGYVSKYHIAASRAAGIPITATCDRKFEAAQSVAAQVDAKPFRTSEELLESGLVDAVVIATPHFSHAQLTLDAFARDLHVLVEKPLTVTVSEADKLTAAHAAKPHLVFAVDFQQRAWPLWNEVKKRLADGSVGDVYRFNWTITDWYRTQHYYRQSAWRGTWTGEGGGVLVNQCPHQLDLICWFFGLPQRVLASTRFGKHHQIEVEDEVHAILEYPNGCVGSFITSTGEPFGQNRLEIFGDRALIRVTSQTTLEVITLDRSGREHTMTVAARDTTPSKSTWKQDYPEYKNEYVDIVRNFGDACMGRTRAIATGEDASLSVDLANAMLLSGYEHRPAVLPSDRAAFDRVLKTFQGR
jgi:predicted dehydrogenase